jgi:hypothetical protein
MRKCVNYLPIAIGIVAFIVVMIITTCHGAPLVSIYTIGLAALLVVLPIINTVRRRKL